MASETSPYRVLARKYRPRDFTALIGQEPMVRTLTNAFAAGRIAQAWMLTGVRGVGKTTTARILARALNYRTAETDRPSIDLAQPGEHCEAILEGRHVDIIEMDAASHTGIDDIREIIEQVRYRPVSARYKVYIIDEVHMLSTQAFNGLLKTLEEPPEHVKFIFATTEIRKVPITVLSRCQRFDLRRIEADTLVSHLRMIAGQENIEADDAALSMIARAAEGSVRDSLSILDQAIAHGGGAVTADAVRAMLGLADRARIVDLFEQVMKGDVSAALDELRAQYDAGAEPAVVMTDLADFTHLVTRLKFAERAGQDLSLSQEERERGAEFAKALPVRVLSRAWQMLLKGIAEVEQAARPIAAAEMLLIRLAHASDLPPLDEALKRLDAALEGGAVPTGAPSGGRGGGAPSAAFGGGAAAAIAQPSRAVPASGAASATMRLVASRDETQPQAQAEQPVRAPETPPAETVKIESLADIAALAEKHRDPVMRASVRSFLKPVRLEPGKLEVALTEAAPKTLPGDLSRKLKDWTGRAWLVTVSREAGGPTLEEQDAAVRSDAMADAANDPQVRAILAAFPGAKIIDVRLAGPAADADINLDTDEAAPAPIELPDDDDDF